MSPYVLCAVFCERFLSEKDEVASLIRLVDNATQTVHVAAGAPEGIVENAPYEMPLTFYVSLWADKPGEHKLEIFTTYEDGRRDPILERQLSFASARTGQNVAVRFESFPRPGTLWVDVRIDGVVRTRTPLTLRRVLGSALQ